MLVEMWENWLHVGLVEILSDNEKALSVSRLQLTDSPVQNFDGLLKRQHWGHIHSNDGN